MEIGQPSRNENKLSCKATESKKFDCQDDYEKIQKRRVGKIIELGMQFGEPRNLNKERIEGVGQNRST